MNNVEITHFLGRLLLAPLFCTPTEKILDRLKEPVEWEKIIEVASDNLITPALYTSFSSLKVFHDLPEDLQKYLTEIHLGNAQRNREIKEQVLQIASLFNKIGVEPLFLKGVANLFYDIYPDPADRIMLDADILVPKERLLECVHILKGEGYYSVYDEYLFDVNSRHHYFPLISDRKQTIVELHQYSVGSRYACLYSKDDFWALSAAKTIEDARFRLPSPMDHIKHHIIHTYHHYGVSGHGNFFLRGFYDLAFLCRKFEAYINWSLLETSFDQAGFRKTFISHLLGADHFCGYQYPLRHVEVKNMERLFLHSVNIYLKYPKLFALWKLFSQYKQKSYVIATDRKRRKEFLKKLKNPQFYVRLATKIRQCFSRY
jgi:hypothetical protein